MSTVEETLAVVQIVSATELESASDMRVWLVKRASTLLVPPDNAEAYVFIHAVHAVQFALLTNTGLDASLDTVLDPDLVQEVRVFNQSGELHLWRTDVGFAWRILQDAPATAIADETHFQSDYTHYLWGNHLGSDGHTLVDRDRGMRITLPISGEADSSAHATYTVRNYLGYDRDGQVQLLDARLMSLDHKGR